MQKRTKGVISGCTSYVLWGVLSLFWALLKEVPALDILAYRFIFSLIFMVVVLSFQKNWRAFFASVRTLWQSGKIIWVILSSLFIALNWGTYIYMVGHGQATEASLGYYIMPLLNVVVAVFVFREPLSKINLLAVILATTGVVLLTVQTGSLPINTIIMAFSFCFYGILKKQIALPASFSLTLETIVCFPLAVGYLLFSNTLSFVSYDGLTITLLMMSGAITAIPLLLFTIAAKLVNFLTLSFIQYINPSIQLLVAIFFLHEAFDPHKLIVFAFIWVGILLFTIGSFYHYRQAILLKK